MQQWLVGEQAQNHWDHIAELISEYYMALLKSGLPDDVARAVITNYAGMLNVVVVQSLVSLITQKGVKSEVGDPATNLPLQTDKQATGTV